MRLIIVSGRSGSGKSTALNVLEDNGFYCIDNLPASLLPDLAQRALLHTELLHEDQFLCCVPDTHALARRR